MNEQRILVAGIGNVFLGDDAFGVEVVRQLMSRNLPEDVRVLDIGIRGMALLFELMEVHRAVVLVDAVPRGGQPGSLYLIKPLIESAGEDPPIPMMDAHNIDLVQVLRAAQAMGGHMNRVLIVGCEPEVADDSTAEFAGLSPAVKHAVPAAVELVEKLIPRLRQDPPNDLFNQLDSDSDELLRTISCTTPNQDR